MPEPIAPETLDALFRCARKQTPDVALRMLGQVATGMPADLVINGFALHDLADPRLVDPSRPGVAPRILAPLDEISLSEWGLCLSRCDAGQGDGRLDWLQPGLVALRAGMLMRCLDTAFLHLEGRESLGQKLLHHQLMKARFSTLNADVMRLQDELGTPALQRDAAGLAAMQRLLTGHFREAAKLMGGHGLLAGRLHALEFLANIVMAIHAPRAPDRIGSLA
ncbi:MAG: hypothetical protein AB7U46_09460 [Paenirhodobacter sp.]|uniref:hypothetical protein n=1 Tax=Paenirhodobacter sp. TaxID=1965326 RepID=UPI003D12A396